MSCGICGLGLFTEEQPLHCCYAHAKQAQLRVQRLLDEGTKVIAQRMPVSLPQPVYKGRPL